MEKSKEPRDTRLYPDFVHPEREPRPPPLKRSYYHSPADQDYLYKAAAIIKPVVVTSAAIGLFDAYMHQGLRTFVPIIAHGSLYIWPGITAGGVFIAANAVAVKINGKDTPWCHFWGGFATTAYISHAFKLRAVWPAAFIAGFAAVRYRYARVREIETGIPMFKAATGKFAHQSEPTMLSHLARFPPAYKMPSETPEL